MVTLSVRGNVKLKPNLDDVFVTMDLNPTRIAFGAALILAVLAAFVGTFYMKSQIESNMQIGPGTKLTLSSINDELQRMQDYDAQVHCINPSQPDNDCRSQLVQNGQDARQTIVRWPADAQFNRTRTAFIDKWEKEANLAQATMNAINQGNLETAAVKEQLNQLMIARVQSEVPLAQAQFEARMIDRATYSQRLAGVNDQLTRLGVEPSQQATAVTY